MLTMYPKPLPQAESTHLPAHALARTRLHILKNGMHEKLCAWIYEQALVDTPFTAQSCPA